MDVCSMAPKGMHNGCRTALSCNVSASNAMCHLTAINSPALFLILNVDDSLYCGLHSRMAVSSTERA